MRKMGKQGQKMIQAENIDLGEVVSIYGTGWTPGEQVGLFISGADEWYIGATTDAQTGVLRAIYVPDTAGSYTIKAFENNKRAAATCEFTVS